MSTTRIIILIGLALVVLGFVATLQVDTDSSLGKTIYGNPFVPALLFFVFFGAFAGISKILVDGVLPKWQSGPENRRWERARKAGKRNFLTKSLLFSGVPIALMLIAEFAASDHSSYVLRNFIVLAFVLLGGTVAIANAIWSYQESLYLKSEQEKLPSSHDG